MPVSFWAHGGWRAANVNYIAPSRVHRLFGLTSLLRREDYSASEHYYFIHSVLIVWSFPAGDWRKPWLVSDMTADYLRSRYAECFAAFSLFSKAPHLLSVWSYPEALIIRYFLCFCGPWFSYYYILSSLLHPGTMEYQMDSVKADLEKIMYTVGQFIIVLAALLEIYLLFPPVGFILWQLIAISLNVQTQGAFKLPRGVISFTVSCARKPGTWYSSISTILHDYVSYVLPDWTKTYWLVKQSGKYYKPWKSSQKLIMVTSKRHITELSEATELSQRAVYADVSS